MRRFVRNDAPSAQGRSSQIGELRGETAPLTSRGRGLDPSFEWKRTTRLSHDERDGFRSSARPQDAARSRMGSVILARQPNGRVALDWRTRSEGHTRSAVGNRTRTREGPGEQSASERAVGWLTLTPRRPQRLTRLFAPNVTATSSTAGRSRSSGCRPARRFGPDRPDFESRHERQGFRFAKRAEVRESRPRRSLTSFTTQQSASLRKLP